MSVELSAGITASTHEPLSPRETVSAPPQEGNPIEAQPVLADQVQGVDPSNHKVPEEETNVGHSRHSQFKTAKGGHPTRVVHADKSVTLGRRVHQNGEVRMPTKSEADKKADDARKVSTFTRGGADRGEYPGVSSRDWNSTGAPAPNKKQS